MGTDDLQTSRGPELAFGPFRFYPEQRVLLRADAPVSLGSRAREILVVLVERAGSIVKKHEFMARVWPDAIVEQGTLRVHIAALRKALGDGQDGMRYVENVTGHGYRFVAALRRVEEPTPAPIELAHAAAQSDPLLVAGTVASALGLTSSSQDPLPDIVEFLRHRKMLIVLDNCEHIIEAAALLAERLRTDAPSMSVMAISRESLRAKGEWVLRLAPLELPLPGVVLSAAEALGFPAIELFTEHARASLDTLELSDTDAAAVADICRKLDGVPLAIELAAARVTLFGISGPASWLDDRIGLLTIGRRTAVARHQTLRALLDWSCEILPRAQQVALRRLAVFAGLFDASAAAVLLVDDEIDAGAVPELLAELVAKSLLSMQLAGEEVLYRFPDTTRAYALEKLEESLESARIKRRHAQLCSLWGQDDLDGELRSLREWTAGNNQRVDDVRAALDWCRSPAGDPMLGVRLAATSAPIWFQSPFVNEYRGRLEGALRTVKTLGIEDAALELQLNSALGSATLYATGWSPSASAAFNRTLELAERVGATVHHRRALWGLWLGRINAGDYLSALGFAEAFCLFARSSSDDGAMVAGDRMMALAHHFLGNQVSARHHAERALTWPARPVVRLSDSHFQIEHRIAVRAELARILWIQGFPDRAVRVGRDSLGRAQSSGHSLSLCYALTNVCGILLRTGDLPEATRLIAMLLDHSSRHSLAYWHFWGHCLELALARKNRNPRVDHGTLRDPLCNPLHQESLATLDEGLATQEAIVRAENGLAGWCAAELLRVKAEALLGEPGANAAAAEAVLRRSLEIAGKQGALSWELRTATSLARLWHSQRRTPEAHTLLASVYARFTEGFESTDLVKARTLLDEMAAHKRRSSPLNGVDAAPDASRRMRAGS